MSARKQNRKSRLISVMRPQASRCSTRDLAFERIEPRRLLASGDLELTFGASGIVKTEIDDATAAAYSAYDSIVQADGKVVAVGDGGLARYLPNGTLDPSFGIAGRQSVPFTSRTIVQTGDGKYLVAGFRSKLGGTDSAVARFDSSGSIDPSFGGSGVVITDFAGLDGFAGMALQTDGKLVAVGNADSAVLVVRFLPNGALDSTFDGDGSWNRQFQTLESGKDVRITSTGKIVVLGHTTSTSTFQKDLIVLRLSAIGRLDSTFDGDGWMTISGGRTDTPTALSIVAGNRILVGGIVTDSTGNLSEVVKLNENGSLDTSFDGDGVRTDLIQASVNPNGDMYVSPSGKILVVLGGNTTLQAFRYTASGLRDVSLDGDGFVQHTNFVNPRSVVLDTLGRIVVSGSRLDRQFAVGRLLADGSIDASFGVDGRQRTDFGATIDHAVDLSAQPNGKWIGLANSNDHVALVRYLANGQLDTSFSGDGKLVFDFGANFDISKAASIRMQADGKLLVAGMAQRFNSAGYSSEFAVARFNTDGALDNSFSQDGLVTIPLTEYVSHVAGVVVQPDGRIVVAGDDGGKIIMIRLLANGILDTTFDGDGIRTTRLSASSIEVSAISLLSNGYFMLAGNYSNGTARRLWLSKYASNGAPDRTFDGDGILYDSSNAQRIATEMAVMSDGRIVVSGATEVYDSRNNVYRNQFAVSRYLPDGQHDPNFGWNGLVSQQIGLPGIAAGLSVRSDGRIIVAGFSDFDPTVVQLNVDGSLDSSFGGDGKTTTNISTPTSEKVARVRTDSSGRVVVFGSAIENGDYDLYLVRYRNDLEGPVSTLLSLNAGGAIELSDKWSRDDALEVSRLGDKLIITDKTTDSRARITVTGIPGAELLSAKSVSIPWSFVEATGRPLQMLLSGGDDRLELNTLQNADLFPSQGITVSMDKGVDSILMVNNSTTNNWNINGKSATASIGSLGTVRALGVERVLGGAGSDTFVLSGESVDIVGQIDGAGGSDTVRATRDADFVTSENLLPQGTFYLTIDAAVDQTFRLAGIEALNITGGPSANLIDGRGFRGIATFRGGSGNDIIYGGRGNDLLFGDDGNDIVQGFDGDDQIWGGLGSDILIGEFGSDRIDGGTGEDIVTGGYFAFFNSFNVDVTARNLIASAWFGSGSYTERIELIGTTGLGANGQYKLQSGYGSFSDFVVDTLWGGADFDWFFAKTTGSDSEVGLLTGGVRDRISEELIEALI